MAGNLCVLSSLSSRRSPSELRSFWRQGVHLASTCLDQLGLEISTPFWEASSLARSRDGKPDWVSITKPFAMKSEF